jgi:hypothetical protein
VRRNRLTRASAATRARARSLCRAAGAAGALALLWPGRAAALCPNCLGQSPTLTPTLRLVGLFLLVPPAVFFAVARVIRALERRERAAQGSAPGSSPAAPASGSGGGDQGGCSSSDRRSSSAASVPRSATSART